MEETNEVILSQAQLDKIVQQSVESILLQMPDVIGNLMKNHAALHSTNKEFYAANPEFTKHKDVVMSVLQKMEGERPAEKYENLIQEAVPEISRQIEIMKKASFERLQPEKIDHTYPAITRQKSSHGEI